MQGFPTCRPGGPGCWATTAGAGLLLSTTSTVVVLAALVAVFLLAPGSAQVRHTFFNPTDMWQALVGDPKAGYYSVGEALWLNIRMFVAAEIGILIVGLIVAVIRQSTGPVLLPLRVVATVYVDVARGVPLILIIFAIGFGAPALRLTVISDQSAATVERNVTLAPVKVLGLSRSEATTQAAELLDRFGLGEKRADYPDRLSGGQQQRVAIVRALAMRPRLMLLDEVTSALDPELVADVLDVIRELAEGGMTMLIATHEMGFARDIARRVCFLADGEIVEQAPPDRLFSEPSDERTRRFLRRIVDAGRL